MMQVVRMGLGERGRAYACALVLVPGCSAGSADAQEGASVTGTSGSATSSTTAGIEETTGGATGTSGSSTSAGSSSSTTGASTCNGVADLCDRPYDRVVFPGTHNSVAATESGFSSLNANQTRPVLAQLEDGIRVLLLDVTYDGEQTALCHGPCALGSRPHVEVLLELRDFMHANPDEVVTIIYQDSVDASDVEADFMAAELVDLAYVHDGGPWPTLGEMVSQGRRLVVTAEVGGPPPEWYHHVWDLAFDTPYTFTDVSAFTCTLNRGQADNQLFLMNHWLSTEASLPDMSAAPEANTFEVLMQRVTDCETTMGRRPTFIAVDFYEQGDLFAVVDALNESQ